VAELAECARAVLESDGETVLNYGPAAGYRPLRELLAERHGVSSGEILVTNGSLQALGLLTTRLGAERRLLVEAPTYDRALTIASRLGVAVHDVAHDGEGIDPDALERELRRDPSPAFLYVLPTFQNPSGRTIGLERRRSLVALAERYDLLLLEDDPYRLVRYEGEDVPSLRELDQTGRVLHTSSFSKIVAPGLRVGYSVLPAQLATELEAAAVNTYLAPTFPTQAIVFEFLRRGLLESSVARVRGLLGARRDAMTAALVRELPEATWTRPQGGYFLWLGLPEGVDARQLLAASEEAGVSFVPGSAFFLDPERGADSARLAFSAATPEEIAEGVGRLAGVCAGALV
jgi:DNA-binding transcriptional MocR family regulator